MSDLKQDVEKLSRDVAELKELVRDLVEVKLKDGVSASPDGLAALRDAIIGRVSHAHTDLYLHLQEASRLRNLYYRDLMLMIDRLAEIIPRSPAILHTGAPIAADTDDHKFPWGTVNDNTRSPRFVTACERYFGDGRTLGLIDLGCSGGGLVLDFILRGHAGYGIEGSDASKLAQRAEWRILRGNLFTADITKPFRLATPGGDVVKADVISAWEVMEHIAAADLPQLFANVLDHLAPDGLFIGSICMLRDDDPNTGAAYHRTVEARDWWEARFRQLGMRMIEDHGFQFGDFCRGTSNGGLDGNYAQHPETGFHYVAVRDA